MSKRRNRNSGDSAASGVMKTAAAAPAEALRLAKRSRRYLLVMLPLVALVILAYAYRIQLFGVDKPVRIACSIILLVIGWEIARDIRRALMPQLYGHLPPSHADIVSFVIRLVTLIVAVLLALSIAGVAPKTLVLGSLFIAALVTVTAQQTLGNLIAGIVLLAARPFEHGDRINLTGSGQNIVGVVTARGLLYLGCELDGGDTILVPNNSVLSMSVRPGHAATGVELSATLPASVKAKDLQERLASTITVGTRAAPALRWQAYKDGQAEVIVSAIPTDPEDHEQLAEEILAALNEIGAESPKTPA